MVPGWGVEALLVTLAVTKLVPEVSGFPRTFNFNLLREPNPHENDVEQLTSSSEYHDTTSSFPCSILCTQRSHASCKTSATRKTKANDIPRTENGEAPCLYHLVDSLLIERFNIECFNRPIE